MDRIAVWSCVVSLIAGGPWTAALAGEGLTAPAGLCLEEAVRVGLERNPSLAAMRAQVDAAIGGEREAAPTRWPRVTADVGAHRTDHHVLAFGDKLLAGEFEAEDFLLENLNDSDSITHVGAGVGLEVPLFTSGRIRSEVEAARWQAGAARARLRAAEADLAAQIAEALFGVPLAEAAGVAEAALKDACGHEAMARARFEAGASLRSDLLRAQTLRLSREHDLERRRADALLARARLRQLMGRGGG